MILHDSNILARHMLQDIHDHSRRSTQLLAKAARGEAELFIPATAVAEITWLLIKQKQVPKDDVADALLDILRMPGIIVEHESSIFDALMNLRDLSGLSFVDCYHLALAKELGMTQVYSFDKKMGRNLGIERVEPE